MKLVKWETLQREHEFVFGENEKIKDIKEFKSWMNIWNIKDNGLTATS